MESSLQRAEMIVEGMVQGVGFRYFVLRHAQSLGLTGFVKNLFSGEVYAVAEGERYKLEELYKQLKLGPSNAYVKSVSVKWAEYKNEFTRFEITY